MPENFPYEKQPEKGDMMQFLVDAKFLGDGRKWDVKTIDGVPMTTAGKANAPGDEAEATDDYKEEAAEIPDAEADSEAEGPSDETPKPSGKLEAPESRSIGKTFASKVMGG